MNKSVRRIFTRSILATCLQIIEKNTKVRLKIVGTRVDATEIVRIRICPSSHSSMHMVELTVSGPRRRDYLQFAIGTIKEDHLGVID